MCAVFLTGSPEARAKSAARFMGWKTGTCGAPPAAGRRPASGSSTEPFRPLLPNVATQGPGKALPGIRGIEFLGGIKAKKKQKISTTLL